MTNTLSSLRKSWFYYILRGLPCWPFRDVKHDMVDSAGTTFCMSKCHKFRTRRVAMAKNIPQLFRSLKDRQSKWPSRTKTILSEHDGWRTAHRLYCLSITGRISRCRFEYAVWLAETTFFYGADSTAEQPLNCILTPYHQFDVTASCLF